MPYQLFDNSSVHAHGTQLVAQLQEGGREGGEEVEGGSIATASLVGSTMWKPLIRGLGT